MATRSPRSTCSRLSTEASAATLRNASCEETPWYRPSPLNRKQSGFACLATAFRNNSLRVVISLEPMPLREFTTLTQESKAILASSDRVVGSSADLRLVIGDFRIALSGLKFAV